MTGIGSRLDLHVLGGNRETGIVRQREGQACARGARRVHVLAPDRELGLGFLLMKIVGSSDGAAGTGSGGSRPSRRAARTRCHIKKLARAAVSSTVLQRS